MFFNLHGFIWIYMDLHGFKWIYMDYYGFTWIYMDLYGFTWITMDLHGFTWIYIYTYLAKLMFFRSSMRIESCYINLYIYISIHILQN